MVATTLRAHESERRLGGRPHPQAGYGKPGDGWKVGENLGWGTGERATPNALVDAWLNSPPHKKNMLTGAYRELGVGVAVGAPKASTALPGATYTLNLGVIR